MNVNLIEDFGVLIEGRVAREYIYHLRKTKNIKVDLIDGDVCKHMLNGFCILTINLSYIKIPDGMDKNDVRINLGKWLRIENKFFNNKNK